MSNVSAAWGNIAANGTPTASSAATAMPITLLQQEDVGRHWRSAAGTTAYFYFSFATPQSADTFAILGTNLTAAGIVRVRLFPLFSDLAGGTNVIWDSNPTSTPGQVDPNYEDAIVLAPAVQSGWTQMFVNLTDTSLSYMEAGFVFAGTRSQFAYNYDFGAQRTVIDPSEQKKTRGGQTKVIAKPKFRRWDFEVGWMTETQRWSVAEAMDLANGASSPVLFMMDPASTNMGRDSIFGFLQDLSGVATLQAFDNSGNPMYSRSYRIDERL